MHTSRHTTAEKQPHILHRNGSFYYNRRVPKHAVGAFGTSLRIWLSRDREEAGAISSELSKRLESLWSNPRLTSEVDLKAIVAVSRPRLENLGHWVDEYLRLKGIDPTPTRMASGALVALVGDRDVRSYGREDARALVEHLSERGCKTRTVRRRLVSLSAIFNHAYSELEFEKRNPFSRMLIQGEGKDAKKRDVFTLGELKAGYAEAFTSGREIWLLMPLLGETGCRLGEVVGLRIEDIALDAGTIRLVPHPARRLKTTGSEREIPLVGYARQAMERLVDGRSEGYLFERYLKDGQIKSTHASNALNKWLKKRFGGKTAHGLRHTFRDRLRAVECPLEMIDGLGGWSSIGTAGARYGRGYGLEHKRLWLERIALG